MVLACLLLNLIWSAIVPLCIYLLYSVWFDQCILSDPGLCESLLPSLSRINLPLVTWNCRESGEERWSQWHQSSSDWDSIRGVSGWVVDGMITRPVASECVGRRVHEESEFIYLLVSLGWHVTDADQLSPNGVSWWFAGWWSQWKSEEEAV